MVIVFIFLLHIIFLVTITIKTIKTQSAAAAIQNIIFVVIIFSVGWTLFGFIINLFVEPVGFGKFFNRNTITLVLLTIGESFFYFSKGASMFGIIADEKSVNVNDKEIQ